MSVDHWNTAYTSQPSHGWDQDQPGRDPAQLIDAGLRPDDSVIDVGGGDGAFTATLLDRGHRDLTVLDISAEATRGGRNRVRQRERMVTWTHADARNWEPERTFDVWHDRASFHFPTTAEDQRAYYRVLRAATSPPALVCIGTFALDGPTHCSGLPVARYDDATLAAALRGSQLRLKLLANGTEDHSTPTGATQRFTWVTLRGRG